MIPWDKLHGAMTHFPIALLMFSTACDFISVAFRALVIQSGIKDEMPSFAKKYSEQDTDAIVAYLKTLH
jgi:uncharacterized membrane protein